MQFNTTKSRKNKINDKKNIKLWKIQTCTRNLKANVKQKYLLKIDFKITWAMSFRYDEIRRKLKKLIKGAIGNTNEGEKFFECQSKISE